MDIELVNAAINGDRRSLARTLSGIENGLFKLEQIRQSVTHSSKSHQQNVWTSLAITGAPGVGKSCLIDKLLKIWAGAGLKIALLAIDPSSPRTGGALLGDRVRITSVDDESVKHNIYIRSIATRKSSEMFLDIASKLPNLIGGSADLAGSNNTKTKNHKIITPGNFSGNYIHYGVREHAMCGIMNGIALHSDLIPYGGTFLIFSDYCKPSIRLAAMMKQRVIYVFTHDSIGLGEDGPTHQPIEQLTSLRSIPNLNVFRPADLIETFECWQLAIENKSSPSVIALTRQGVEPIRDKNSLKNESSAGAYEVLRTGDNIKLTIISSGSETSLACDISHKLATEGIYSKVVSMPCQELFDQQNKEYKNKILTETELVVSIEASETNYWKKYTGINGLNFGIDDFGKSAPYKEIYDHFNLNSNSIIQKIKERL